MLLTPMRTAVRDELADITEAILTVRMIDRSITNAVGDLSRYFPRQLIYDKTVVLTVDDEAWTSGVAHGTYVTLANDHVKPLSESVTDAAGTTTYVRDTDYTMNYSDGKITTISGGDMAVATAYLVSYSNLPTGFSVSPIVSGLVRIDKVESPAGQTPQKFVSFDKYGNWLSLLGSTAGQINLTEDSHVWVYYRAVHTIPTTIAEGSYPDFLDDVIIKGTVAYCYGTLYHYWLLQAKVHLVAAAAAIAATEAYSTGATDSAKVTLALMEAETDLANTALDKVTALVTAADGNLTTGAALINTVTTGANVGELFNMYANSELEQAKTFIYEAAQRIAHGQTIVAKAAQMNTVAYNLDSSSKNYISVVMQDLEIAKQYKERANEKLGEFYASLKSRHEWMTVGSSVATQQSKG